MGGEGVVIKGGIANKKLEKILGNFSDEQRDGIGCCQGTCAVP